MGGKSIAMAFRQVYTLPLFFSSSIHDVMKGCPVREAPSTADRLFISSFIFCWNPCMAWKMQAVFLYYIMGRFRGTSFSFTKTFLFEPGALSGKK